MWTMAFGYFLPICKLVFILLMDYFAVQKPFFSPQKLRGHKHFFYYQGRNNVPKLIITAAIQKSHIF